MLAFNGKSPDELKGNLGSRALETCPKRLLVKRHSQNHYSNVLS